jgi:hypothetical protein
MFVGHRKNLASFMNEIINVLSLTIYEVEIMFRWNFEEIFGMRWNQN